MNLQEKLLANGLTLDDIWSFAYLLTELIINIHPLPKGLDPEDYVRIGCTEATAVILAEFDIKEIKDSLNSLMAHYSHHTH